MTATRQERQHAGTVSLAVVRAMIDDATAHDYGPEHRDAAAVLGIYGDPSSLKPSRFDHAGVPVQVAPCVSALAVREALLTRDPNAWLVVVTDRPEEDLGVGILAHLAGHKLRTPDPWAAVRQQFSAAGLETALYADPSTRPLAHGLLLARPEAGWPPAPAGALTRDHALGSVARAWLDVPRRSLDSLGVLRWTASPGLTGRIAELRALAGDELTDATLAWVCASAGAAGTPLTHLLRRGEISDALPLGLVLGLLVGPADATSPGASAHVGLSPEEDGDTRHTRELALARLAHRWHGPAPSTASLRALGDAANQVVADLLRERVTAANARELLHRADALLGEVGAPALAERSEVLPGGLTARLHLVGDHLRAATAGLATRHQADPGSVPALVARHTQDIETAWAATARHLLAAPDRPGPADPRLAPMLAAVRLSRWLAHEEAAADEVLASLALRQGSTDAWVDAAVNDAYEGVADPALAEALTAVLAVVEAVRDRHDAQFAAALARATRDDEGTPDGYLTPPGGTDRVWLLEHLVRGAVVPLVRATPTLLLVLDGMSTSVATEIVDDVLARREGWEEALLPQAHVRATGVAVLPSLTEVSRASLLSGRLTTGQQGQEQTGHAALVSALGLRSPQVFHKKPLDTSRPGFAVADDVALAIADTSQELVTCVLNTIDDALDRSDPAGTAWTADAVKHLRPLLDRALAAGRTVVLTADHGHVVERRRGRQQSSKDASSGRSRPADVAPGEGEVLVSGPRVLKHGGTAVLPFDERLRYGPLKAGYHGGASPAEVVVPVVVLVPGPDVPDGSGLRLAPPQAPRWWDVASGEAAMVQVEVTRRPSRPAKPQPQDDSLFDTAIVEAPAAARSTHEVRLGDAVVRSDAWAQQRGVSGRVALEDEQVVAAIEALAAAPGTRLPLASLASVMALPATRAQGAVAQLQRLLNVEGYAVVRTDGPVVVLDVPLLREQFGIGG
ncbi:BREX-2 system phosphatase PglZ [Ornithinimicrobium cerasi]|uniref:PglZ domain-containing protein n=1 Tax=Ornithinimicrobium cerasi TaxID=2248773 RepID=A0A285VI54_9MICO|nr:BREX-2 system phosphatase PglZ [Ornithinimicrobium cerasi]SOC53730.1 PglZ domain-containing protein [Ornithinimicrobium cerasi]